MNKDLNIKIMLYNQFTFKTIPKAFTDELGITRTVIGIQARINSSFDLDLNVTNFYRSFYIAFLLETGTLYGQRNASTTEFVERAVGNGIPREMALASVMNICKKLEYGTVEEKYLAASQLANIYLYELLPLEQQLEVEEEQIQESVE